MFYWKINKTIIINNHIKKIIPPQSIDLEEAIIGAIIVDKKALDDIIDLIPYEVFYKKEHQIIFETIKKLYIESHPVDLYTLSNELKRIDKLEIIGGELYLAELTQKVISSAHIEYHCRIVIQKFLLRRLINLSFEITRKCYEEKTDVFNILNFAESKVFEINQKYLVKKKYENTKDLVQQAIDRIKTTKKNGIIGISTGFQKLDDITSGWQNSDLIIIASRPGMGKTTFMLSMIQNIAVKKKIPSVIFSLEMSSIQLITKLISSETCLSLDKLKKSNLSMEEYDLLISRTKDLKESSLFIDDTPSLSIFNLRAKCRYLITQYGVRLIFVDYMQLMNTNDYENKFQNREQEISLISRNLKSMAKELNLPIIALSQLSRAVETRGGNKRPLLSDLRESGSIEQDADIVLFIYRPEYYGFNYWDSNQENDSCIGQSEIIIAKHRNGRLGSFRLRFIGDQSKFKNIEEKKYIPLVWEEDYKKNVIEKENEFIPPYEEGNFSR
ncbi:replicative DNA helicase [Blattabacterium cuenoti]|uniref:replicative DNA helicase n=1 Tax=Blattabacterium cuenoti TaxID=1653831 RepID=UPI00163CF8B0